MNYILIFIGGGLGSIVRFELGQKISRFAGTAFPWGTVLVNATSCLILGLLLNLFEGKGTFHTSARLLLFVGFCGGFSTFSSFTLQTFELMKSGHLILAALNIIMSVVVCLFSFWAGWWLSKIWS